MALIRSSLHSTSLKTSSLAVEKSTENNLETELVVGGILDDETLIRKAFDISAEAGCEYLFRRYHSPLCNHALRFVMSKEKAEDIVSDVFCKFWKNGSYKTVNSSFRYYLFRSVRNEAYTHLRSEFSGLESLDKTKYFASSKSEQPDEITQYEETFNRVKQLVDELPPQCRKVFLMSRFEGKSYKEIAEVLGLSVRTVETHVSKGLFLVRKGLSEYLVYFLTFFATAHEMI